MKTIGTFFLILSLAATGCVSNARHKLEVREAYVAGQQQAMAQMRPASTTDVIVHGNVSNSLVPWAEGMTLAKAIFEAHYNDTHHDPRMIILRRGVETMQITPDDLINGGDVPVKAGDVIELVR